MRITSRCTRGAVVGEFAGQVWSGTSTQPCLNPAPHVIVKRPSQRHGDPLEQCTLNLSLSSCDSPARPDGSARVRRPPQGGWRPGIKHLWATGGSCYACCCCCNGSARQSQCQHVWLAPHVRRGRNKSVAGGTEVHTQAEPKQTRGSTHDATSHNSTTRARPRARDGSP